ncbi:hypothetical protein SLE2022_235320 [Rubroshorea leprosula]
MLPFMASIDAFSWFADDASSRSTSSIIFLGQYCCIFKVYWQCYLSWLILVPLQDLLVLLFFMANISAIFGLLAAFLSLMASICVTSRPARDVAQSSLGWHLCHNKLIM